MKAKKQVSTKSSLEKIMFMVPAMKLVANCRQEMAIALQITSHQQWENVGS